MQLAGTRYKGFLSKKDAFPFSSTEKTWIFERCKSNGFMKRKELVK